MRALKISGAILIALRLLLIIEPPSYAHEESVFKLRDVEAKPQERCPIPSWVASTVSICMN